MDTTSIRSIWPAALRYALLGLTLTILSGCNLATRLSEIGDGPEVSQIQNPMSRADYTPVSLPMPTPLIVEDNPNSLWRAGARAFFKDHRAKAVGDIVTVKIDLDDKAEMDNSTERERADTEDTDLTKFLGLELELAKKLPQGIGTTTTSFGAAHKTKGDGAIERAEEIEVKIAAVVTQILPNGALVLVGRQEILINAELRELYVTGVVRPSDIDSDNTVSQDYIAEMRLAYGGRGDLSQLQQPRWGMQIWDVIFPF